MDEEKDAVNKKIDYKKIKLKAANYCAYQERSPNKVLEKIIAWGLPEDKASQLLEELKSEKFIDEYRFASLFTRGKFYQNKWGKIKIEYYLRQENISDEVIMTALSEIPADDYQTLIDKLISQKWHQEKETDKFRKKNKVARYLISKGFETELVWRQIKARE